jgi:Icc-related predicted phosphoesterase
MKIIALSDLHNATSYLEPLAEKLSRVDLVLLAGDLTNAGKVEDVSNIITTIRKSNRSILAVAGNWDGPQVGDYLESEGISLHRKHTLVENIAFSGVGGSLAFNQSPNEISEADFASFLNQSVEGLDRQIPKILVCHQPPFNTLADKTWANQQVGSKSVRSFIEKIQPLICFTGHIHEGAGIDTIGITKIINPGPVWKGQYGYAEIVEKQVSCLEIRTF